MYIMKGTDAAKVEPVTFSDLKMKESDVEELLRKNVDLVCDDEESMLLVGQQVKNEKLGRSDLTAIDNKGNMVLIEIKRDKKDIEGRKEAFEFQAIRYAANIATIQTTEELVQSIFSPYVSKHRDEFNYQKGMSDDEIATRYLLEFLKNNGATEFNQKQRIILVAGEFDEQTLSAVAWLNSNKVDISCYEICPFKIGDNIVFNMNKILPVPEYEDFYVAVSKKSAVYTKKNTNTMITRRSLPKINAMLEWGIVKAGDIIIAKGTTEEATLCADGQIEYAGKKTSIQKWLKSITGWSSVETYAFSVHKKTGRTLSDLRAEYMAKEE